MLNIKQNQLDRLETDIRNGTKVDCPNVLYDYLYLGNKLARTFPSFIRHKIYDRMFHTSLETICDPLIAKHWRQTCLDNINRSLLNMHQQAKTCGEQRQVMRLTGEKEIHTAKVKKEVSVIWGDYFKQPPIGQCPDTHTLVHNIMLAGSACKQYIDREKGMYLLSLVNAFTASFWATKKNDIYEATCPYLPLKAWCIRN